MFRSSTSGGLAFTRLFSKYVIYSSESNERWCEKQMLHFRVLSNNIPVFSKGSFYEYRFQVSCIFFAED